MSHITQIKTQITDINALAAAAGQVGAELVRQATFRSFGGRRYSCDYAIRIPGNTDAYEIGVAKSEVGYTLLFDSWAGGRGMMEKVGNNCDQLLQAYDEQLAMDQVKLLQAQGWTLSRQVTKEGDVRLELSEPGAAAGGFGSANPWGS